MRGKSVRWPQWTTVLEAWEESSVPEVAIVDFKIGEHYPSLPWLDRHTGKQYVGSSSPQISTAYHLCVLLPREPAELRTAYRLNAFCWHHQIKVFPEYVLRSVFKKFGSDLYEWWNRNAKYVLPPLDSRDYYKLFSQVNQLSGSNWSQTKYWKEIVSAAALTWRLIAEEWAVIRIPKFMDYDSAEYKEYQNYLHALHENREREEYERLKRKFEGNS